MQNPEQEEFPEEETVEEGTSEPEEQHAGEERVTEKLPAFTTRFDEMDVSNDERTMAALAHGSIIFTLFTGGVGGLIVALVVWAVHRDKSEWVAHQALQALAFQLVATVITYVLWFITGILFFLVSIIIGICLLPLAFIFVLVAAAFPLAATAYGLWGALETYRGRDFQYWLIADFVRERT